MAKAGLEPVNTRVSTVGRRNHSATELVEILREQFRIISCCQKWSILGWPLRPKWTKVEAKLVQAEIRRTDR